MNCERIYLPTATAIGVIVLSIFVASPNFRSVHPDRPTVYGGDALQEWLGSRLARTEPDRLYDQARAIQLQNDPQYVGYRTDPSKFFPMVYPPFYYVSLRPLSFLSALQAANLQLVAMGLAAMACFWLASRVPVAEAANRWLPWVLVAGAMFMPLVKSLCMAQKSAVVLFLFTASYALFRRHRLFMSGLAAGVLAFKPQLLLPTMVLMAWHRQWRWLAGCLTSLMGLATLCLPVGWQACGEYAQFIRHAGDYVHSGGYAMYASHSLRGFFELLLPFTMTAEWPIKGAQTAAWLAAFAVAWVVASEGRGNGRTWAGRESAERGGVAENSRPVRGEHEEPADILFATACLVTPLVSPHFYTYDLTMLLLPMFLMWKASYTAPGWQSLRWQALLLYVGCMISEPIASRFGVQISVLILVEVLVWLYWVLPTRVASASAISKTRWTAHGFARQG